MTATLSASQQDTGGISSGYQLLPFRFDRWADERYFLSNEAGEFLVLPPDTFQAFVSHRLPPTHACYPDLQAKHFLVDSHASAHLDVLAAKYRTKKSFLDGFIKLHIFVTTLRCNHACPYCQVSRQGQQADAGRYDMTPEILDRSVRLMLASPAPRITLEFQGGEPLLHFELLQEAVHLATALNQRVNKQIDYVLCTNLSLLEDRHLDWCQANQVLISTSLDGPAFLHDRNRPLGKHNTSYAVVTRNLRRAQEALGRPAVSALMTTTRDSLQYPQAIVDEYRRLNLGSLFVRELNPYGFAIKSAAVLGYPVAEFIRFYQAILDSIIALNRTGVTFAETFTTLLLTKILTPWPVGFVDLQSPSGAGIGVCLYNYDGDVYVSDEARMLAEAGDYTFRMGNVLEDSYESLFFGNTIQAIAAACCNEALAGCADCAYQGYCGADPVRNYRTQKDIFGNRAVNNSYCRRNKAIIQHVLRLLDTADGDLERIFWAWIQQADVNRLRLG